MSLLPWILALLVMALSSVRAAVIDAPVATGVSRPNDAAVVIDVSDNEDWGRLPSARRDADVFALTAERTLGIPEGNVFVLHDPSANTIRATLRTAASRVGPAGRVWVHYGGHGTVRASGQNLLLIAADTPRESEAWGDTVLTEVEIQSLATAGGAELVLTVDACNPTEARAAVPDRVSAKVSRGVYVRSTSPGQTAQALRGTGHGAFSYFWLGAMRGWADGEPEVTGTPRVPDGVVTLREAQMYTKARLDGAGLREQTPEVARFAVTSDDFKLVQCGSAGCERESRIDEERRGCPDHDTDYGGWLACHLRLPGETEQARAAVQRDATKAWGLLPAVGTQWRAGALGEYLRQWLPRTVTVEGYPFGAAPVELIAAWKELGPNVEVRGVRTKDGLVTLPGGTFWMGRLDGEEEGDSDEKPAHLVTVAPFAAMDAPVTQKAYAALMHTTPWVAAFNGTNLAEKDWKGDDLPAVGMNWCEAVAYANARTLAEGLGASAQVYTGVTECTKTAGGSVGMRATKGYRLLAEAEREYAARAGTREAWAGTGDPKLLNDYSNGDGASDGYVGMAPVYAKVPNRFGLYGMSGGVWEWVGDVYGVYDPEGLDVVLNPFLPSGTGSRVVRGGSWRSGASDRRVASRYRDVPSYSRNFPRPPARPVLVICALAVWPSARGRDVVPPLPHRCGARSCWGGPGGAAPRAARV